MVKTLVTSLLLFIAAVVITPTYQVRYEGAVPSMKTTYVCGVVKYTYVSTGTSNSWVMYTYGKYVLYIN